MRIMDLIGKCYSEDVVISNKHYALSLGVITLANEVEIFVWIWEDGRIVRDDTSRSGYKDVILSPKLISDRGWYVNKNIQVDVSSMINRPDKCKRCFTKLGKEHIVFADFYYCKSCYEKIKEPDIRL